MGYISILCYIGVIYFLYGMWYAVPSLISITVLSDLFLKVTEIQHTDHGDEVYVPEANKVEVKLFKNVTRCGCIELNPLPR